MPDTTGLTLGTHQGITVAHDETSGALSLSVNGTDLSLGTPQPSVLRLNIATGADVVIPAATLTSAGLLTSADKTKLDALPSGGAAALREIIEDVAGNMLLVGPHAGCNVIYNDVTNSVSIQVTGAGSSSVSPTNLSSSAASASVTLASSTGTGATIAAANPSTAGVMTSADKAKLDVLPVDAAALVETILDAVAAAFSSGTQTGLTIAYNDASGAFSFTNTGGGGGGTATNLGVGPATATTVPVTSSTGTSATLLSATSTTAGLLSAADKTALDASVTALAPAALNETIDDRVAALLAAGTHTGITVGYNDAGNAISLTAAAGAAGTANLALGASTATSQPVTNSNGTGFTLPAATTTTAGLLSAADKVALNAAALATAPSAMTEAAQDAAAAMIAAGTHTGLTATYNDASNTLSLAVTAAGVTNLGMGTATATTLPLTSSSGTGVTLPAATTAAAGLFSAADKTKLDLLPSTDALQVEKIEDTVAALIAAGTHSNITVTYTDNATGLGSISLVGATSGGVLTTNVWIPVPSIFRLRLTGTGTVVLDSRNSLGVITLNVGTFIAAAATDQIEFPFAGISAVAVRGTFPATMTVEVI